MLKSYEAIYTDDGHLEWLRERPGAGRHRVIVTVLNPAQEPGTPPPAPDEIRHILDEMQRLRDRKKSPDEVQQILDETRGAWGTEKTLEEIDQEIDDMRAEWDRPWDEPNGKPKP